MHKKLLSYLFIISVLLVNSGCTTVSKSCVFGGCYGPFEVILKAEKGERVEDVIVALSYTRATSHGGDNVYRGYAIGNTGEPIMLPRGFFSHKGIGTLEGTIYHPDYEVIFAPNIKKTPGVINLGTIIIESKQDRRDHSIAKETESLRKKGWSEEKINIKLKDKREYSPGSRLNPLYFATLLNLGRQDLYDKYLPRYLKDYYEYKGFNVEQSAAFDKKMMKNISIYRR
jgi:hypothetical protein